MRYALLICNDESSAISEEERSRRDAAFIAFQNQTRARGVLVVADGPFAETKEQIVGFLIVDCKDLDEAIEVATKVPTAWYGTVEVRPAWEM